MGYNIKNEPSPERVSPVLSDWYSGNYEGWYKKVKGTPADLNLFYSKIVREIRKIDAETPIVLDSGFYATPWAFKILEPVNDSKVIYSFHMYEPYAFTNHRNKGKFTYPGKIPTGESGSVQVDWNASEIKKFLQPIVDWQKKFKIPSNRIFAGEFGLYRYNNDSAKYFTDLLKVLNKNNWHWAFYSFREDDWQGMDYELGMKKPDWKYWEAIEQKRFPDYSSYKPNKVWNVLLKALNGSK